ncbi:TatD family hydrolase [Gracilinema caldarium]|uniref:Hydrolase, TatD family n=1 Tax=Gracilinema caldarium (strain ATCC 51460 / DSM 7334 / H1) TaxID=744872 RepID=F8F0S9_GRAC1|nr:TatD family hydrolase [Gracilinema caldarium]AEJ19786.1 hydrolase, TatD family [Gracilinema caldarium DSM 7334]
MIPFIDSHAHLSMLPKTPEAVQTYIDEWNTAGLAWIIDVGTQAEDLELRIASITQAFGTQDETKLVYSAGIWPSAEAIQHRHRYIDKLTTQIQRCPRGLLVAIGECGIDRYWNHPEKGADIQGEQELLAAHLELAQIYSLPVIIHSRDAARETLDVLKAFPRVQGVIHCFSYGKTEMKAFIKQGWYISFAGNVTYKNAQSLREALQEVPLDRMLLETDSPYLAPVPHRGKTNNPAMVVHQYEVAARIKNLPLEELAQQIKSNFTSLFIRP